MTFADRIKAARRHAAITQQELAKHLGIRQTSISDLERGKSQSTSFAYQIAKICGVDADWLVLGKGAMELSQPKQLAETASFCCSSNVHPTPSQASNRRAPVISWVAAGDWPEAENIYQPGYAENWEPVPGSSGQHAFWLEVVGDSMTSPQGLSIPEGYLILVDPDAEADNGKLVVAKLEGEQEVTFKRLVIDVGQKYLKPLNPVYQMIQINGNCRIVGVVTEVKLKL